MKELGPIRDARVTVALMEIVLKARRGHPAPLRVLPAVPVPRPRDDSDAEGIRLDVVPLLVEKREADVRRRASSCRSRPLQGGGPFDARGETAVRPGGCRERGGVAGLEGREAMLVSLWESGRGTTRKFVCFAVGYARLELPADEFTGHGLDVFERFSEGLVTSEELAASHGWAWERNLHELVEELLGGTLEGHEPVDESRVRSLFCCVFGNPFRPPPPLPPAVLAWSDRLVPRLAQAIYDDRRLPEGTLDPARLGILADALLDAGCEDEELLGHLRSTGPHVRGCFAIDLILGRS